MAKSKTPKAPKPPKLTRKERVAAAKLEKVIRAQWGAPRKYDDPVEFDYECRKYFAMLGWNAPSISGLCRHLGISRETWYVYKKERKQFADTISFVDLRILETWENILSKAGRAAGAIFYLTNIRPDLFKQRGVGDEDTPVHIKAITGIRIVREKK